MFCRRCLSASDALALLADAQLVALVCLEQLVHQALAYHAGQLRQQLAHVFALLIQGQAHAQAKLGVVFEQRVRPGRTAAFVVLGPRGGGQVAAVDRRTAGGVGHDDTVAEQLGEQLDIGRLAAAGAGAGELEQRLQKLGVLYRFQADLRAIDFGQASGSNPT